MNLDDDVIESIEVDVIESIEVDVIESIDLVVDELSVVELSADEVRASIVLVTPEATELADAKIRQRGLENAIDHDFKNALTNTECYIYVKELYKRFLAQSPGSADRYNFSVFLKTLDGLPKSVIAPIAKEVERLIHKFNPRPHNGVTPRSITISDFHPIGLSLTLKVLVQYLVKHNELGLIRSTPLAVLYPRLIDELSPNACSIYNALFKLKKTYDAYKINGRTLDHYLPVSWMELQTYLIKHPTEDLWASKYNKIVENEIYSAVMMRNTYHDTINYAHYEKDYKMTLNHEQKQAIAVSVRNGRSMLQGNAGCGKSTISMIIADVFIQSKETVLFLTISAKARNLLRDKIKKSFQASSPVAHTFAAWNIGKEPYHNIIVDESSMIGNDQLLTLLRANSKRLILMGDAKQILPVCQVGCPFIALQNGFIQTTVLTIQHRQASDNPIVKFVQQAVDKQPTMPPEYNGEKEGVFFKTLNEDDFLSFYCDLHKVNGFFCIKSANFRQLSDRIQGTIQKDILPIHQRNTTIFGSTYTKIYLGDPVVRTKAVKLSIKTGDKNEIVEVPNGTFGIKTLTGVIYNQKHNGVPILETTNYMFNEFQLAYAQSAHKTQGSEYNVVLVALHDTSDRYEGAKNIFYTSITRSKKLLVLCGNIQDKKTMLHTMSSDFANPHHTLDVHTFVDPKYRLSYKGARHTIRYYPIPSLEPCLTSPFESIKKVTVVEISGEVVDSGDNYRYLCKCGASIKYASKKAHERSKKHRSVIKN